MKRCAFTVLLALSVTSAHGEPSSTQSLEANGARLLAKTEVEGLLFGARVTISDPKAGTRSWTHNGRRHVIATLERPSPAASRPLHGEGTVRVDENGAYCVRIEWPRALESWCRRIFTLNGGYYAVSDDPGQPEVVVLQIIQPNANRLSALGRLWYLAR